MSVSQMYPRRFAAMLAAARLEVVDPRFTPEEYPESVFGTVGISQEVILPPPSVFPPRTTMFAREVEAYLKSDQFVRAGLEPASIADGLHFCATNDLSFNGKEYNCVMIFGACARTKRLMPSFQTRNIHGRRRRVVEMLAAFNEGDRFCMDVAYLMRRRGN